jgi:AmmeMemoRadiSam system protein A
MIVFGIISPHPPIIIPEIGGKATKQVAKTIAALEEAAHDLAAAKPDEIIIISPHEGHGFEVPLHYLGRHLPGELPVQQELVDRDSYGFYYKFGQELGQQLADSPRRYAIVASGDLSHVLKADGPYGFDPAGPKLDKLIIAAVKKSSAASLLKIPTATLDAGAECGLRSILFLLGALEAAHLEQTASHYEGPFGVGYLTTVYQIPQATRAVTPAGLPAQLKHPAAAFVSLHDAGGDLRGCIGTVEPTKPSLAAEIITNAVSAAVHDPRFEPVTAAELPSLSISVDVLSKPEAVPDQSELDPSKFGVIVTASGGRRGLLLPDLPEVTSVEEQLAVCREKGVIGLDEPVTLERFTVTRHHE